MGKYKIFITDDEELICEALEIVIQAEPDLEVVGTANNGLDALARIDKVKPDLVLMDVRMPEMDGITCTKKLKERYPHMLILILTTYNEEKYIIDGLAHGANGYLLKNNDFPQLIATIRSTLHGQYVLPAEVAAKLSVFLMNAKSANQLDQLPPNLVDQFALTPREQEILLHLANRLAIREMAEKLYISEGTIKNYLTVIYHKLGVSNRYEAILLVRGE